ncbi:hypothetical protein EJ08DRAFT_728840 [Tothia fuscella]|uniref:F-box domain-containing protein n=1 Tax=Tothia fuscella TaxID=1048955 RepID=A0A9P4P4M8_9PEZI|nr:hypothetical protein EJ08DRAFT_728840 [Tothia fuscella]
MDPRHIYLPLGKRELGSRGVGSPRLGGTFQLQTVTYWELPGLASVDFTIQSSKKIRYLHETLWPPKSFGFQILVLPQQPRPCSISAQMVPLLPNELKSIIAEQLNVNDPEDLKTLLNLRLEYQPPPRNWLPQLPTQSRSQNFVIFTVVPHYDTLDDLNSDADETPVPEQPRAIGDCLNEQNSLWTLSDIRERRSNNIPNQLARVFDLVENCTAFAVNNAEGLFLNKTHGLTKCLDYHPVHKWDELLSEVIFLEVVIATLCLASVTVQSFSLEFKMRSASHVVLREPPLAASSLAFSQVRYLHLGNIWRGGKNLVGFIEQMPDLETLSLSDFPYGMQCTAAFLGRLKCCTLRNLRLYDVGVESDALTCFLASHNQTLRYVHLIKVRFGFSCGHDYKWLELFKGLRGTHQLKQLILKPWWTKRSDEHLNSYRLATVEWDRLGETQVMVGDIDAPLKKASDTFRLS